MLGSSGFSSPSPTRSAHSYVEVSVVGRPSLHLLFAVVTESDRCRTQGVPYPLLFSPSSRLGKPKVVFPYTNLLVGLLSWVSAEKSVADRGATIAAATLQAASCDYRSVEVREEWRGMACTFLARCQSRGPAGSVCLPWSCCLS